MQDNYSFLLTVYDKLLETLQDGVTLSDVYSTVVQFVEEQKPHLKDYFTKSLGYGILLIGLSTQSTITGVWQREDKCTIVKHNLL